MNHVFMSANYKLKIQQSGTMVWIHLTDLSEILIHGASSFNLRTNVCTEQAFASDERDYTPLAPIITQLEMIAGHVEQACVAASNEADGVRLEKRWVAYMRAISLCQAMQN